MSTESTVSASRALASALLLAAPVLACSGGSSFTTASEPDGSASDMGDSGAGGTIVIGPSRMDASMAATQGSMADASTGQSTAGQPDAGQPDAGPPQVSDGGLSDAPSCPASNLTCDAGCVPNDTSNCGTCGTACTAPANGTVSCADNGGSYACVPACNQGYTICGGACLPSDDLQSDSKNCGACGHDCKAGACVAGVCQPWLVGQGASPATHPTGIPVTVPSVATDGTNVAWVEDHGCHEAPMLGGASTSLAGAADLTGDYGAIAMASGTVALIRSEYNESPDIAVLTGNPNGYAAGLSNDNSDSASGFAINPAGTVAYFNREGRTSSNVWSCDVATANVSCSSLFPSNSGHNDVAVSPAFLFLTDFSNSRVLRYPLPAGPPSVYVNDEGEPYLLAVDASYVYWASQLLGGVSILRTSQASAANVETVVFNYPGTVNHIAADGTNVYFSGTLTSTGDGILASAPANGGVAGASPKAPAVLYQGDSVLSVVAGGAAIFWYDNANYKIYGLVP